MCIFSYFTYARNIKVALVICYNHQYSRWRDLHSRWGEAGTVVRRELLDGAFYRVGMPWTWFFFSVEHHPSSSPRRKLVHFVGWIRRGCISEITCRAGHVFTSRFSRTIFSSFGRDWSCEFRHAPFSRTNLDAFYPLFQKGNHIQVILK